MAAQIPVSGTSPSPSGESAEGVRAIPEAISNPTRRRLSRAQRWTLIGVGIVVVIILGATLGYTYIPVVATCELGSRLGTYNVTAPELIANFPYMGGAGVNESGQNWTFSSGGVVLGNLVHSTGGFGMWGTRGGSGLELQLGQPIFAVYSVHNVSGPFPRGSHPCTQPYVAETVSSGYCGGGGFAGYPLPDPSNDSVEPHIFNSSCPSIPNGSGIASGAYMSIDNSFPMNPAAGAVQTLNLCSWTTNFSQAVRGAVALPITLYAPDDGRVLSVQGYLWWVSVLTDVPTASYSLPHGAIWRVATVGLFSEDAPGLLPPGLLAFEELPCP
jgi:hypothetical protein